MARLKEWRAVATGYEETAISFASVLSLAATIDWIERWQSLANIILPWNLHNAIRSGRFIAGDGEMASTGGRREAVQAAPDGVPEVWNGPRRRAAQDGLKLGIGHFDEVQVDYPVRFEGWVGAVNLTGTVFGAECWLASDRISQPLTVANGGILRISDPGGQITVLVLRVLTAGAVGDACRVSGATRDRTRVLIYMLDTHGRRQTLGVVPFEVFDGSEAQSVNDVAQVVLVSRTTSVQIVAPASQGAPDLSKICESPYQREPV